VSTLRWPIHTTKLDQHLLGGHSVGNELRIDESILDILDRCR
jgi:hypothetical protein